ncbi:FmdB family zinc ribbon protein [Schlegelella aquatica]|uniref:FmdB family zinc ribbon protein n=1 Tax=Caldimonas aquatica TaxID=376175 RepID=UPI003750B67E
MPIYAYKCESCGHGQDVMQKISDPLLTVCPQCGASTFRKQVTAAGFQLKGSGWYVTDFRGGSSSAGSSSGSSSGNGGDSTSDGGGKSESASAAGGACGSSCACH